MVEDLGIGIPKVTTFLVYIDVHINGIHTIGSYLHGMTILANEEYKFNMFTPGPIWWDWM